MSNSHILLWETLGTALLILIGNGAVASVVLKDSIAKANNAGWVSIVLGWGFAVFTGASVAASSGAHLNPAVTLGLALNDKVEWSAVPFYFVGQLVGAIIGACLCWAAFKPLFDTHDDNANTRGIFCTAPAVRNLPWNFVTEVIATFVLVIFILTNPALNAGLGIAGVTFVVMAIGFALGGPTGYAINPVRDLGPRIAYSFLPIKGKGDCDWAYSWVPVAGPVVGGLIAGLLATRLPGFGG